MKKLFIVFALFLSLSSFVHAESDEYLTRDRVMQLILNNLNIDIDKEVTCSASQRYTDLGEGDAGSVATCMRIDIENGKQWNPEAPVTNEAMLRLIVQAYFIGSDAKYAHSNFYMKILERMGINEIESLELEDPAKESILLEILEQLPVLRSNYSAEENLEEEAKMGLLTVKKVKEKDKVNRHSGKQERVKVRDLVLSFYEPVILEGYYIDDGYGMLSGAHFFPISNEWQTPIIESAEGIFMWGRGFRLYFHGMGKEALPLGTRGWAKIKISTIKYNTSGHPMNSYMIPTSYEVLDYDVMEDLMPHGERVGMWRKMPDEGHFFAYRKEEKDAEWKVDFENSFKKTYNRALNLEGGSLSTDRSFYIFIDKEGGCGKIYSYNIYTKKFMTPKAVSGFCAKAFGKTKEIREKGEYNSIKYSNYVEVYNSQNGGRYFFAENRVTDKRIVSPKRLVVDINNTSLRNIEWEGGSAKVYNKFKTWTPHTKKSLSQVLFNTPLKISEKYNFSKEKHDNRNYPYIQANVQEVFPFLIKKYDRKFYEDTKIRLDFPGMEEIPLYSWGQIQLTVDEISFRMEKIEENIFEFPITVTKATIQRVKPRGTKEEREELMLEDNNALLRRSTALELIFNNGVQRAYCSFKEPVGFLDVQEGTVSRVAECLRLINAEDYKGKKFNPNGAINFHEVSEIIRKSHIIPLKKRVDMFLRRMLETLGWREGVTKEELSNLLHELEPINFPILNMEINDIGAVVGDAKVVKIGGNADFDRKEVTLEFDRAIILSGKYKQHQASASFISLHFQEENRFPFLVKPRRKRNRVFGGKPISLYFPTHGVISNKDILFKKGHKGEVRMKIKKLIMHEYNETGDKMLELIDPEVLSFTEEKITF